MSGDLLQRHLLCRATGQHDRGKDGRCRDCTIPLEPGDPCAPELGFRATPDEDEQR